MPRIDFNGDGRSDILWLLGDNYAVGNWLATAQGGFSINHGSLQRLTAMHTFDLAAHGDFNGDGRTDLIFEVDNSGAYQIWPAAEDGSFPTAFSSNLSFMMIDPN